MRASLGRYAGMVVDVPLSGMLEECVKMVQVG
jgi:hypothetical protein